MKKWAIVMLVMSLFTFGATSAFAAGSSSAGDAAKRQKQFSCNLTVIQLNQVLAKTRNEQVRALLKNVIASFKAQCLANTGTDTSANTKKVTEDKDALAIQFLGSDNANGVTLPVILPSRGKNGSAVAWTSSNPQVLSNDGLTIRRANSADVAVNLTAVLKFNNATATKTFRVVVKGSYPQLSDSERVARDKDALAIGFGGSDNIGSVTQPLKSLPAKGKNGSDIKWTSLSPAVISNDGRTVNRPAYGSGDTIAVFTALIKSGGYTDMKIFTLTVKQQLPDPQRVAADKAALQIDFGGSDSAGRVTRPLDGLPSRGVNGSVVSWITSVPNVLSADGKSLHRPGTGAGDVYVVLTAVINSGSASDVKNFVLTVKDGYNNQEKTVADKDDLAISYQSGDSSSHVTRSIGLPSKGYYGSTIVWYSSNPGVLSSNGTSIHRPAHGKGDASVTLTAVVSNNGAGVIRTFTVTVKQQ